MFDFNIKLPDRGRRRATGPDDFGDGLTIGMQVKRRGLEIWTSKESDFGEFAGRNESNQFVITLYDEDGCKGTTVETFDDVEALHKEWVLD